MTIFIPDISHHQEDISIQGLINDGAAALMARVGQGAGRRGNGQTYGTTRDRKWARNMAEAKRLGLPLVAYWYVGNLISADENARLAAEWVGDTSLPWMIDHEDASGSIAFYREVLAAFARRGLRVVLGYVPKWYWNGAGRGSLAGPPLVNSAYPAGSGTAAQIYGDGSRHAGNFADYGGNSVALLQFTNQALMAGQRVDCSAFKGTKAQFIALLGGPQEEDMTPAQEAKLDQLISFFNQSAPSPGGQTVYDAIWEVRGLVQALPAPGDLDEAAIAVALGPVLAPLINAGATPAQVEDAVRHVFASAGQAGGTV